MITFVLTRSSTAYNWPLLTKGLFSHRECLSFNQHASSMPIGDFKLIPNQKLQGHISLSSIKTISHHIGETFKNTTKAQNGQWGR
uniref:SFRICE_012670 n=1 Tax=Spodoptera frugiperda TaxID=7108 RepID=A0A2H1VE31_SPOFR